MNSILWAIYIIILLLAYLPLFKISLFSAGDKYYYFKHMSISLFVWVLFSGLEFGISNPSVLYMFMLLKYPFVFSTIALTFIAVLRFLNIKIPKALSIFIALFFLTDVIISATNSMHGLMLDIGLSDTVTRDLILNADYGPFFTVHLLVSYSFFFIVFAFVFYHFYRVLRIEKDAFPFVALLVTSTIGVVFNIIHIFVYTFMFDPTFMVYVGFTTVLYFIFIIRDARLIIKFGNNEFLLNNLREMYLIVNHNDEVIEASEALQDWFDVPLDDGKKLDEVIKIIETKAIIFSNSKKEINGFDPNKSYIHRQTKDINLPFLKYPGHMILFYDETQIQKYINDMDYVMNHDLMTGLYNRNYLESIREKYDHEDFYSTVIFDLDGLKLFNDYLGHHHGDDLLNRFSKVLEDIALKSGDSIAIRMGGDEFLLILETIEQNEIEYIIDQIKEKTDDNNIINAIGFSYGYYINGQANNFSHALSEADSMMYQMKDKRGVNKRELKKALKMKSSKD